MRRLLAALQEAGLMPPGVGPEVLRRRIAVFGANLHAMRRYRPRRRYPGRLTLVRAAGSPDTRTGWSRIAEHVDDHVVPGNHYSIWDPDHLPGLAETIGRSIERAL